MDKYVDCEDFVKGEGNCGELRGLVLKRERLDFRGEGLDRVEVVGLFRWQRMKGSSYVQRGG